ncbi:MAG: hypothetical protein R2681_10765 [Pyrinomonadaceae bacterium]
MGLLEQQNFLARLYVDEDFRKRFAAEPENIGRQNKLTGSEIADLEMILPDEVEAFAQSLYHKRFREVEKLLPFARKSLVEEFGILFEEFSATYNPNSVKKHIEDAFQFCRFLSGNPRLSKSQKAAVRFEQAKLEFFGLGKSFVFRRFGGGIKTDNGKRRRFGLWLRLGKREFII